MNLLIFGDTHLGKFDPLKYAYLEKIIRRADKVIINGDFWDSWFISFDAFINSKWSKLFPLLLSKQTIYIFGNHDSEEKNDDRVKYFSAEAISSYQVEWEKQTMIITHDAKAKPEDFPLILRCYQNLLNNNELTSLGVLVRYGIHIMEHAGYVLLGKKMVTNNFLAKKLNSVQKKYKPKKTWCIYGHTHRDEIDTQSCYINSGSILYGYSSYLTLNSKGIKLHQERY